MVGNDVVVGYYLVRELRVELADEARLIVFNDFFDNIFDLIANLCFHVFSDKITWSRSDIRLDMLA